MLLLTRAVEDSIKSKELLTKLGFNVFIEPMFQVRYFPAKVAGICGYDCIVVTSRHGIIGMSKATQERGMRIIAVGDRTMEYALTLGFSNVYSVGGRVCDILQCLGETMKGSNVLYVRGAKVSHDLRAAARSLGISVTEIVLYATVDSGEISYECLEHLNNGRISRVLFYSERTAKIFVRLMKVACLTEEVIRSISVYTISGGASNILHSHPWRGIFVSRHPTEASLVELLLGSD